jgi:hypothetical protein
MAAAKVALLLMSGLVFSFIAAGENESDQLSDETIRSLVPGAWISQEILDGQPMTLTVEYRPDGTFGASAGIAEGRYRTKLVLRGTWRVHNRVLINHTEATGMPARTTIYQVVAVTETVLILRDRDGGIVVKRRAWKNSQ